jgi:hypothetical protein
MISPKPIDLTELTTEGLAERTERLMLRVNVKREAVGRLQTYKALLVTNGDWEKRKEGGR